MTSTSTHPATVALSALIASAGAMSEAVAAPSGTAEAVVRVRMAPEVPRATFRFAGAPAGELAFVAGEANTLRASGLAPGSFVSTLAFVDPAVSEAGYSLASIQCDDAGSAGRSSGDLGRKAASFRLEAGETVACDFVFAKRSCICPKEGRWQATNHPGSMVCTGAMSMTVPLGPSAQKGTLEVRDGCSTLVAEGLSEDDATIVMRAASDCSFEGSVGGSQDGIPMTIHFTWQVPDSEKITGDLHSQVSKQGMTCNMSRTYEMKYLGQ